jgi:hypothetical protein
MSQAAKKLVGITCHTGWSWQWFQVSGYGLARHFRGRQHLWLLEDGFPSHDISPVMIHDIRHI